MMQANHHNQLQNVKVNIHANMCMHAVMCYYVT